VRDGSSDTCEYLVQIPQRRSLLDRVATVVARAEVSAIGSSSDPPRVMSAFAVPEVVDNPDGWGPSTLPEHLKDVPFAPFGKTDKLGKASDWTQAQYQKYAGTRPACVLTAATIAMHTRRCRRR
jgi:hypothetical protein